jgi:hypothetical protein
MTSAFLTPRPSRRLWPWMLLAFTGVAAAVAGYLLFVAEKPPQPPDYTLALAANARGVGHMEQFEYAKAAKEFERAVELAPKWVPARVNHGIALFNQTEPEALAAARQVFQEVLRHDPSSKHAHYCLGVIAASDGRTADAHAHFQQVHAEDKDDAFTWYRLGVTHPDGPHSPQAGECYREALDRNPYLNAARYGLSLIVGEADPKRADAMRAEFDALKQATWETEVDIRYGVMGKYADVIGRDPTREGEPAVGPLPPFEPMPGFRVTLAAGVRWTTPADLDPVRQAARDRFGSTLVLFDFNGDGKPDVFLPSAVVDGSKIRDLLLRNDGDGTFTDVTSAAGLATPRKSLGTAIGDFDNDGRPDLVITGAGEQHLFRNGGDGTFTDVSAAVGLDKVTGTCLGCGWVDLDQDSDLDLVVCQYGEGDPGAFDRARPGGGVLLFENVGVAEPNQPRLTTAFRPSDKLNDVLKGVAPAGAPVAVVASDLDADRDVDLLLVTEAGPVVIDNERLLRFKRLKPGWNAVANQSSRWNSGLVLDVDHDDRSDLFLIRHSASPLLLLSAGSRDFAPGNTNSPPLKQAVAVDLDLDGWADVVGVAADGKPVLLHNQGDGRLQLVPEAFGPVAASDAMAMADFDGDGRPDVLTRTATGLQLLRNMGNGNSGVWIDPTGKRDKGSDMRTNADGIGTRITVHAGTLYTGAERTTTSAGLGQSLLPTVIGLGKATTADVVRLRWPDAVIQAELGIAAGRVARIAETNRKGTSCPILMTWDGGRFAFVTDFLGGGALGESGPDGSIRPPRPEESVKIEPGQLVAKGGQFVLKIAEPMDEVLYLDHLRLEVIDHPATTAVFPDERFAFGPPEPTQKLLAFATRHTPKSATDHRGRDVLTQLRERDRRAVDGFARRSWLGYAENHSLTLDFGDLPAGGNWWLVLAGWTEYPYPESMYAATRAGVNLKPPVLERQTDSGEWVPVCDLGFPAGLPRVMTRQLPNDFRGGRLRIATNAQVFWDHVFVARADEVTNAVSLDVAGATLAARGFMQEVYPGGRPPVAYDDSKTEPVAVTRWKGTLTRLGDVTELLRAADDRFVLCGPGDEITVRFDATKLPPLKGGWARSFVLRTRGYCKDTSPTTVTGGEVGPLPFRAMPNYPHFGAVSAPQTDAAAWHTRPAGR